MSLLRRLGPGVLMAATAIGASHLVLSVQAGAAFGYTLLWVVLVANLVKYPAFEYGPRYAIATGHSLLEGYLRIPGPFRWALLLFLAGTVIQGVGVVAGVISITATVPQTLFPEVPLELWAVLLASIILFLLMSGHYQGMESITKGMMIVLLAATVVAFLVTPIPLKAYTHLVIPALPAGGLVLVVALMGWMPAGIDVSVWHSLWALEKAKEWDPQARPSGRLRLLRIALLDMRIGYGFVAVTAVFFLCLGGALLLPRGLMLTDVEVTPTLARIYVDSLGAWMYPVFLIAAFCTMFSTGYTCMDGFPRAFAAGLALLRGRAEEETAGQSALYWTFLLVVYLGAVLVIFLKPNPVYLVTTVAIISFMFAPIYAALNYYCVTALIGDQALRPGRLNRGLALVGIAFLAVLMVAYLVVAVG